MDNLTMAVMNAIINLAYFILFLFLWFQRRERSLGFFAGAFGAALVGALGLSLQNSPVGIAGILALNIGLYIFYLLATEGFLQLQEARPVRRRPQVYVLLASVLILFFTLVISSFEIRGFISHVTLILLLGEFIYGLKKKKEGLSRGSRQFLMALAISNMGIYLLMSFILLTREVPAPNLLQYDNPLTQLNYMLSFVNFATWASVALILNNQQMVDSLACKNQVLDRMANTDVLTGMASRSYLEVTMDSLLANAERYGQPLSVVLFDLDHFKSINDRFGHLAGDEVLKATGEALLARVRKGDVLGRWGGEEFLLLLPNTNLDQALALGESLRKIQEALVHGEMGVVTLSGGVTQYEPGESRAFFLQKADQALYRAKEEGRNCIRSQLGENSI